MLETTELARYIPDYSIVRLPNGETGYITKNGSLGNPQVRVNGSSVDVDPDDVLEIFHFPVELAARWLREAVPEERTCQALVITTFPEHITSDDVGRKVASVMGIDWEWRTPPRCTVVVAVRPRYGFPAGVAVAIESPHWERPLWYDATALRLLPLEPDLQPTN